MIDYILNLLFTNKRDNKNSMVIKGKNREIKSIQLTKKPNKIKTSVTKDVIEVFESREKFYQKLFKERFC
ncbi:MAG: hypothetical protein II988_06875 [Clostridia bacterium]|nr:hypothetical protein [Clostridia bacterium]